jgi:ferredoxin
MPATKFFLAVTLSLTCLFFLYATIISLYEHEKRAAFISLLSGIILTAPLALIFIFSDYPNSILIVAVPAMYVGVAALLLFPFEMRKKFTIPQPKTKIDERDIMFSRRLIKPGTEKFKAYYKAHPDKEALDDHFRKQPGLLAKGTTYYNPFLFNAAISSFDTIEALHALVEGPVSENKEVVDKDEVSAFLKKWAIKLGAKNVGITLLKNYHKYSHVGRGPDYGKPVELNHKYAIALTVEMDKNLIDTAPDAPVTLETSHQYLESGEVAVQLAVFIRRLGYEARAHIDGNYRVVCPLVARDAGLGDIGRMGLLMTPRQGARVRIAVVTTNLALNVDENHHDHSMTEFCTLCKKCADTCPGNAIPSDDQTEINGIRRWQINQEKCFTYWCKAGTDCGRCIAVCPYSHPDNLFHNLVRYGIKYNPLFRRIAVPMDDLFYGKKPKVKTSPSRIDYKKK